jgi:hypothetical protein
VAPSVQHRAQGFAVEDLARLEGEADVVRAERAGATVVEVEGESRRRLPRAFASFSLPFAVTARLWFLPPAPIGTHAGQEKFVFQHTGVPPQLRRRTRTAQRPRSHSSAPSKCPEVGTVLAPPRARREGPCGRVRERDPVASKCTAHQYDIALPPSALAASQAPTEPSPAPRPRCAPAIARTAGARL